jgi:1-acyl-sn-glycerol-3-phosphate acyltransferase
VKKTRQPFSGVRFRVERVAQIAAGFGYFGAGGWVLGRIVLPIARLGAKDELERIRRCQRVVHRASKQLHRVLEAFSLTHVDIEAYRRAVPDGPAVVVANHPTLLDVTAFLAAHENLCAIVKGDYFRGPTLGALLRACGHIDAGEGSDLDGARVVLTSLERLEQGFSVLVFPEGTRSPVGGMHPFKRGAFDLAARARVPLLAVLVTCDPPALAKGMRWWRSVPDEPFRLQLTPLSLMDWRPWDGQSRLFRKHVQRLMREALHAWKSRNCARKVTTGAAGRPLVMQEQPSWVAGTKSEA